ncbi:hypothetical protein HK097_009160 [Rhizophlyctis rosea]|uniref:Uncharacterized protein n=1 Tax=Rhizophlyctis rosea TaxID=64517 RepID=A0AAD5SAY0_9FUNG|nr:hypothetical protein HK097_009160 [Rhizophlyctis rosea]
MDFFRLAYIWQRYIPATYDGSHSKSTRELFMRILYLLKPYYQSINIFSPDQRTLPEPNRQLFSTMSLADQEFDIYALAADYFYKIELEQLLLRQQETLNEGLTDQRRQKLFTLLIKAADNVSQNGFTGDAESRMLDLLESLGLE